jgi:hypothetical protein
MHFREEEIDTFKALFEEIKFKIRAFPGVLHLECLQDVNDPQIFFTYSHWESEADLENYRNSDLFKSTWVKTKILFEHKAEAWSTETIFRSE